MHFHHLLELFGHNLRLEVCVEACFSYSKRCLSAGLDLASLDLEIPGRAVNHFFGLTHSSTFLILNVKDNYTGYSRRHWREPCIDFLEKCILT